MQDMLVRLYELPDHQPLVNKLKTEGVEIRRVLGCEKHIVLEWVEKYFGKAWAGETECAIFRSSCLIALDKGVLVGMACYDSTCRGFFGPTGVAESCRGRGIGKALLWASLHAMHEYGYAYAIIGGVGPAEFYASAVGATFIENSTPGIYRNLLTTSQISK